MENKIFGIYVWEGEGVKTLVKTRVTEQQGREYGAEDVREVKDCFEGPKTQHGNCKKCELHVKHFYFRMSCT